jgi:hypothetical protein
MIGFMFQIFTHPHYETEISTLHDTYRLSMLGQALTFAALTVEAFLSAKTMTPKLVIGRR